MKKLARTSSFAFRLFIGLIIAAGFFISPLREVVAQSVQRNNIESEIENIGNQIKDAEIQLNGIREERLTLEETLAALRAEMDGLRAVIAQTEAKLVQLETEIAETQVEIDRQKEILGQAFRQLYQRSNTSSIELLVASDSFSEYLDTQEYLSRLKDGITESVNLIQELKAQLQAEEKEQEALLSAQEGQELLLVAAEAEQNNILVQTQGRESLFQEQLDDLEAQQVAKEKELDAYLASLISSTVNLGPVSQGQVIGRLGNTGWSTGPHLHIQVYSGPGSYLEPLATIQSQGWTWPVGGGGGYVSQRYSSGHRAVDIAAAEGTPLQAVASGNIIHRGCLYTGSSYATFGVIIDHGDYYSSYIHMMAPNNSKFNACNTNRRPGSAYFGQPSIDYSITE